MGSRGGAVRLDLVRDAVAAARLPELLPERCVHSLIEQATCRRCVDACPTGAWVIDDERLGIDPDRCDGCGLCAPACPQAAIVARAAEPLRVGSPGRSGFPAATGPEGRPSGRSGFPAATQDRDKNVAPTSAAMLACEGAFAGRSGFPAATGHRDKNVAPTSLASPSEPGRSGFPAATQDRDTNVAPTSDAGIAPCIHALGLRDLARLAAAGCTRLIVATGDCDACPRGGVVRLEGRLADLARILYSRGLPILRVERLPPDRWRAARDAAAPDPGPAIARRAFLRRGLGLAVDRAANAFGLAEAERAGVETVTNLLPETGRSGAIAPVAPRIDPTACTGCDACVRLCPQQAIELARGGVTLVGSGDPLRDGFGGGAGVEWPATTPEGADGAAHRAGPGNRTEADTAAGPAALVYRILPEACTGCGICVDVCADRAARLEAWQPAAPVDVPLAEATCTRCRVRFHRPVIDLAEGPTRCPICARRSGTDRLFRVQE
jgi:ferredoxin